MRIYFAMDLLDKEVVKAFRGERINYKPVHLSSKLLQKSNPFYVIEKIRPRYLYIADLDRIMGKGDNTSIIEEVSGNVHHLIADCGFKEPYELEAIKFDPVLGTETFDIRKLANTKKKVFVSLDIKGELLNSSGTFSWKDALVWLNSYSLEGVIVLMLHRVGTLSPDFSILEKAVEISANPVFIGGGIGNMDDLISVKEIGCSGVLVSTAVHEKKIPLRIVRQGKI
jgi:phosphoribosylformimino-5-aminoimidazole carboxamide ribotide isomerase